MKLILGLAWAFFLTLAGVFMYLAGKYHSRQYLLLSILSVIAVYVSIVVLSHH